MDKVSHTRVQQRRCSLAVLLLLCLLSACDTGSGPGRASSVQSVTIKIAADLPLTGIAAGMGTPVANGIRLAVDEANADPTFLPGYTFVFTPLNNADMNGSPDPSVGAVNLTSLIEDAEVAGLVGPFNSSVAQAELPLSNVAPIVQLGPASTSMCLTQATPETGCVNENDLLEQVRPTAKVTYFRIVAPDTYQGQVGADYAFKTLRSTSAFVLNDTTQYGDDLARAFANEFQDEGGSVVGRSSVAATTDYTQTLRKIALFKPSLVYFAGLDTTGGIQLREQMASFPGLENMPVLGGDGLNTVAFASAIGPRGAPVYSTVALADPTDITTATAFVAHYRKVYGSLGAYSAAGYDCAKILLNAIKAAIKLGTRVPTTSNDIETARIFRQAVIDQVAQTVYSGATGHQSFDANGDTTNKTITIYRLTDVNGKPAWKSVAAQTLP